MPWEHCGQTIADDVVCPVCSTQNETWDLVAAKTRVFSLSARWDGDPDAQAAVLQRAREDGAPFCEA